MLLFPSKIQGEKAKIKTLVNNQKSSVVEAYEWQFQFVKRSVFSGWFFRKIVLVLAHLLYLLSFKQIQMYLISWYFFFKHGIVLCSLSFKKIFLLFSGANLSRQVNNVENGHIENNRYVDEHSNTCWMFAHNFHLNLQFQPQTTISLSYGLNESTRKCLKVKHDYTRR